MRFLRERPMIRPGRRSGAAGKPYLKRGDVIRELAVLDDIMITKKED